MYVRDEMCSSASELRSNYVSVDERVWAPRSGAVCEFKTSNTDVTEKGKKRDSDGKKMSLSRKEARTYHPGCRVGITPSNRKMRSQKKNVGAIKKSMDVQSSISEKSSHQVLVPLKSTIESECNPAVSSSIATNTLMSITEEKKIVVLEDLSLPSKSCY